MSNPVRPEPPLTDRDRALLVGLADGTLEGRRRARAEALVDEIPDGKALVERQRRVARALAGGRVPAMIPVAARAASAPVARARPVWRPRPRMAALATLAAAVLALLTVVLSSERSTVAQAADLARLPATDPAPGSAGKVLRASVDGVAFPDWSAEHGWHETGLRRTSLDGRASTTVFYEHEGHRIAYTIVSGPALDPPADARVVRRAGLEIAVYHDPGHGGHDVAVFERDGSTCVLAGHVIEQETLLKLAAWKGGGQIRS
jgi:hypothetical protein